MKLGSVKDLSFKENYLQRQIVEAVTRIAEFFSDLENSGGHAKFFFQKHIFQKKKNWSTLRQDIVENLNFTSSFILRFDKVWSTLISNSAPLYFTFIGF